MNSDEPRLDIPRFSPGRSRRERARPPQRQRTSAPPPPSPSTRASSLRGSRRSSLRERANSSLSAAGATLRRGSHRVRKRAALAVTSGASLEAALPEQFVGARRRLERLARALKDGLALREAGAPGWRGVLMARADAARTIAGAAAGAGRVRAAADALRAGSAAALSASERAERSASDRTLSEAAGVRVFQTEVSAVLGSCVEVDAALCEFRRYRAKVDRLAESARTKEEKLEANRRKLDVAAAKFAARINCAQAMADSTLEKRDRYLGALLRAFWRAEQTFEEPMREHFREFREAVTRCPAEGVARAPDPDEEDWTTD